MMQIPNTGNNALNALVEMVDSQISQALDGGASMTDVRNALVNASLTIDSLLIEIKKKDQFITFMCPVNPTQ